MAEAAFGHGRSRRLQGYKERVIALANNGIRPHQIRHRRPRSFIAKDIYNLIQAHRLAELNSRSPLQAPSEDHLAPSRNNGLFDFIDTRNTEGHHLIDYQGDLELYRQFPELLLLDSTRTSSRKRSTGLLFQGQYRIVLPLPPLPPLPPL